MKVIKGDLVSMALNNYFDVIVHGCNCFNTMGKGIALDIKKYFPEAYEADCLTIKGDKSKLGSYTKCTKIINVRPLVIINAYTQYTYYFTTEMDKTQPLVSYGAVKEVFTEINKDFAGRIVGIPKIGAGLAMGDWEIIKNILDEVCTDIELIVVEYQPK